MTIRESKIRKIIFGLTEQTNNFKATVWLEDMNENDAPITVAILDMVSELFLTKIDGDTISFQKNGNFWNPIKENNKPSIKKIINNVINSLRFMKNQEKIDISQEEASDMLKAKFNRMNFCYKIALETIKEDKKLDKSFETAKDRNDYAFNMARSMFSDFDKNFIIVGLDKEEV